MILKPTLMGRAVSMSIADESNSEPAAPPLPVAQGASAGPVVDFEALLGAGDDLWADDAEFEAFLAELRRRRQQDREQHRQQ